MKNHFYSKLRKGLRKVNKKIHKFMKREYKDIKTAVLYKILETMETHNKSDDCTEEETVELCKSKIDVKKRSETPCVSMMTATIASKIRMTS